MSPTSAVFEERSLSVRTRISVPSGKRVAADAIVAPLNSAKAKQAMNVIVCRFMHTVPDTPRNWMHDGRRFSAGQPLRFPR